MGSDSAIHGRFHNRGSRKSPYGSNSSLSLDLSTSIVPEDLELPSEVVEVKAPEKEANLVLNSSSIISIGMYIEYRIVVYIRFGFFGKFSLPICLIEVYTFITSDIFLFLYVYFNLYILVELD